MSSLLELLKAKKQSLDAANRRKTAKCPDGTSRWRILPSWRGEGQQFWHDFGQHFVKNAAKEMQAVYACSEKTYGQPCEVCSTISMAIKSSPDSFTTDLLKEAQSSSRVLLNATHLDGPTPNEVQILELPPSVFGQIVAIAQEWEEAGESVFDLARGKDLLISRSGTGKNTKYTVQVAAKVTPLAAGIASKLHDLDEYVRQESTEAKQRALNSVRSVAGLLSAPAPALTSGLPAAAVAAGAASIAEDDPYAVATPPKRTPAPAAAVTDVASRPVAPAPAAEAGTGDADLDKMLAELG